MKATFISDGSMEREIEAFIQRVQRPNLVNADIIADQMRAIVRENFATESGDGRPWVKLKQETVEERQFLGYPGESPILIRSGDLFESATNPNDPDHFESIDVDAVGFSVSIGTNDPRARKLNDGSGRIPARPFMTADNDQGNTLADVIEAYFDALFI